MEDSKRFSLSEDKLLIVCGRMKRKIPVICNTIITYLIFKLCFDVFPIADYLFSISGGFIFLILLCLLPFIIHMLYIFLTKFGYAVLYDDHAKICTKIYTKEFSYYNSLKFEIKAYRVMPYRPETEYYGVKMIFEENGEVKKVHLFTDDPKRFRALAAKFQKAY